MLNIYGNLRVRDNRIRKDGMSVTALTALNTKNAKGIRSIPQLQLPGVVAVTYKTTGMTAAAADTMKLKV